MSKLGGKQMQKDAERLKVLLGVGSVTVSDEGLLQGSATNLNFTGAGVTATVAGSVATVTIPAGSAASSKILLLATAGTVTEYAATAAGMAAAVAAAVAGDTILLPSTTIAGDYTIPVNITVLGRGANSILSGTITISSTGGGASGYCQNLTIGSTYYVDKRTNNSGTAVYLTGIDNSGRVGLNTPPAAGVALTVNGYILCGTSFGVGVAAVRQSLATTSGYFDIMRGADASEAQIRIMSNNTYQWDIGLFSDTTNRRLRIKSTAAGGTALHYFSHDGSVSFSGAVSVGSMGTGFAHDLLSATHSDTLADTVVRGDLLIGNATPKWARLALGGASGSFVTRGATDPAWSTFYLSGTAGGTTSLAVTNAKTLTLTAADNAGLTLVGTGGLTFGGAYTLTVPATGTAALATGISGGQTIYGGTDANDDLILHGTSNATRTSSYVIIQPTAGYTGIGMSAPIGVLTTGGAMYVYNNVTGGNFPAFSIGASGTGYGQIGYGFKVTTTNNQYTYSANDLSSALRMDSGAFYFLTAPSGIAGNNITYTQQMTLTNAGLLGIGDGTSLPACTLHVVAYASSDTALVAHTRLESRRTGGSGGTSAGFGTALDFYAESATDGNYNQQGRIATLWTTATTATRTSNAVFYLVNNAGALTEYARLTPTSFNLPIDSEKLLLGGGLDMSAYYDGTDGYIKTSEVAASDLHITCGAAKTLVLDTAVYDDIQFDLASGKVAGANYPTWETFTTNTAAYAFSVDDYIDLKANEPFHGWSEGTSGVVHVHFALKTAQSTGADRFAKFTAYVAIADVNGAWSEIGPYTAEQTIATGSAALKHFLLDLGTATLAGYHLGAQIKARIKRIAATGGTEYADDVYITQVGIHTQQVRIGSRSPSAA